MTIGKLDANGTLLRNFVMPEEVPHATIYDMVLMEDGSCVAVGSGGAEGAIVAKINHMFTPE